MSEQFAYNARMSGKKTIFRRQVLEYIREAMADFGKCSICSSRTCLLRFGWCIHEKEILIQDGQILYKEVK